jgi:Caspase domain
MRLVFAKSLLFIFFASSELVAQDDTFVEYRKPTGISWWQQQINKYSSLRSITGDDFAFNESFAIVVGIDEYDEFSDLKSSSTDAKRVAAFLIESGFDTVITITNGKVTRSRVDSLIELAESELDTSDRFLFYWSGHGGRASSGDTGDFGFLPMSTTKADGRGPKISMSEFRSWAQRISARHTLFIIDACFSGMATDTKVSPVTKERISKPSDQILTSSAEGEISYGYRNGSGSIFTNAFLSAIGEEGDFTADRNRDGIITLSEIEPKLKESLDEAALSFDYIQSPQRAVVGASLGEFFFVSEPVEIDDAQPVEEADLAVKGPDLTSALVQGEKFEGWVAAGNYNASTRKWIDYRLGDVGQAELLPTVLETNDESTWVTLLAGREVKLLGGTSLFLTPHVGQIESEPYGTAIPGADFVVLDAAIYRSGSDGVLVSLKVRGLVTPSLEAENEIAPMVESETELAIGWVLLGEFVRGDSKWSQVWFSGNINLGEVPVIIQRLEASSGALVSEILVGEAVQALRTQPTYSAPFPAPFPGDTDPEELGEVSENEVYVVDQLRVNRGVRSQVYVKLRPKT